MKRKWIVLGSLAVVHAFVAWFSLMSLVGISAMPPSIRPKLRQAIYTRIWHIANQPLLPVLDKIEVGQSSLVYYGMHLWILLNSVIVVGVGYAVYVGIRHLAHARPQHSA